MRRARFIGLTGLGLLAIGWMLSSCSTLEHTVISPPAVKGASFVGNRACYDCHTNYVRAFAASPHARIHLTDADRMGQTGCEACHGPGSKHIAVGGGRGKFIVNPGRDPAACFECHLATHAEFNLPQHHPLMEKKITCVQCHDPHGMDIMKAARGLAMARLNESCAQCHREQTKPFAFEHPAMREGCVSCHQPHGSINAKLLVARDNNLCLRCHAQLPSAALGSGQLFIGRVDHTGKVRLGTCYSAGCHSSVHGSNIDQRLLY